MADAGTQSDADQAVLTEKVEEAFMPQVTEAARDSLRQMVRTMLPAVAEKIVREEIQRIQEEERSVEIEDSRLSAAVHEAFSQQMESMTREMVRESVAEMLPKLAEKMVLEEIERIKSAG